ncbi:hypothetical protein PGT21_016000 [Puccinia graminis f. sp. tritici]|uniref:Uncharacterized protein n=1 Tax=Puccinia graminis f. sp. tritici TaxID=56615 RepID=A0A5B0MUX4_PUCGR|nr:hypothetical protein PGT21_016000 [Puccinia graminis f. sp. tritici]
MGCGQTERTARSFGSLRASHRLIRPLTDQAGTIESCSVETRQTALLFSFSFFLVSRSVAVGPSVPLHSNHVEYSREQINSETAHGPWVSFREMSTGHLAFFFCQLKKLPSPISLDKIQYLSHTCSSSVKLNAKIQDLLHGSEKKNHEC